MATRVEFDIETPGTVTLVLVGKGEELYKKWDASGLDSDFEEFADWIQDDIADELEITIDAAWEVEL